MARTLVLLPNWPAPSELWMHRMLQAMESSVAAIATYSAPVATWRGHTPALSLLPRLGRMACRLKAPQLVPGLGSRALSEALHRLKIEAVFCHYLPCALRFRNVWQRSDVPLYVHCHGYDVTWNLRMPWWPHPRCFRSDYIDQVRWLAQRAILIANSQATQEKLLEIGVPAERMVVKYLGVPVPAQPPPMRPARPEGLNLLYLGRLIDFKGPLETIQAFDLACRQGLKATLTIAGNGPLKKACEEARLQATYPERIQLLGSVDADTGSQLRAAADIFTAHNCLGAVTGQEEAFGVSIIEAMADGLPVVTGRRGGVAETVVHEQTGYLFEPGDIQAHANALLTLARDPALRHAQGIAAWQRARQHFSLEHEANQLQHILSLQ